MTNASNDFKIDVGRLRENLKKFHESAGQADFRFDPNSFGGSNNAAHLISRNVANDRLGFFEKISGSAGGDFVFDLNGPSNGVFLPKSAEAQLNAPNGQYGAVHRGYGAGHSDIDVYVGRQLDRIEEQFSLDLLEFPDNPEKAAKLAAARIESLQGEVRDGLVGTDPENIFLFNNLDDPILVARAEAAGMDVNEFRLSEQEAFENGIGDRHLGRITENGTVEFRDHDGSLKSTIDLDGYRFDSFKSAVAKFTFDESGSVSLGAGAVGAAALGLTGFAITQMYKEAIAEANNGVVNWETTIDYFKSMDIEFDPNILKDIAVGVGREVAITALASATGLGLLKLAKDVYDGSTELYEALKLASEYSDVPAIDITFRHLSAAVDFAAAIFDGGPEIDWYAVDRSIARVAQTDPTLAFELNKLKIDARDLGFVSKQEFLEIANEAFVKYNAEKVDGQCFAAGTQISMSDGTTKLIEEVRVGDKVASFDPDTGELVAQKVVRLFVGETQEFVELNYLIDGAPVKITSTLGHPFYRPDGSFVAIGELLDGSGEIELVLQNGKTALATANIVTFSEQNGEAYQRSVHCETSGTVALAPVFKDSWGTYNFEVENTHTYVAGGVRVHNRCLETFVTETTLNALVEAGIVNREDAIFSEATGQWIARTPEGERVTEGALEGHLTIKVVETFSDLGKHVGHSIGAVFEDFGIYLEGGLQGLFSDLLAGQDFEESAEAYAKTIIAEMGVDVLANIFGLQALPRDIHGQPTLPDFDNPKFFDTELGGAIKGALVSAAAMRLVSGEKLTSEDYEQLALNGSVKLLVTKVLQTQDWALAAKQLPNSGLLDGLLDHAAKGPALSLAGQTAASAGVSLLLDLLDGGLEDPVAALGNAAIAAGSTYLSGYVVGTYTSASAAAASGGALSQGFSGLLGNSLNGLGALAGPVGFLISAAIGSVLGKLFGGLFTPPPPLFSLEENDDGSVTVYVTDESGGLIYSITADKNGDIIGSSGHDFLEGSEGENALHGQQGDDILYGNGGDDVLTGGKGLDALYGGDGDDEAIGGQGDDTVDGGDGDDLVVGGDGDDVLFGDSQSDEEEAPHDQREEVSELGADGDPDEDDKSAGSDDDAEDASDEEQGEDSDDGKNDDVLIAGAGNDRAFAGKGNDVVYGNFGDDILMGQEGDDVVFGGEQNDFIDGGEGNDVLDGEAGDDIVLGGAGDDVIHGDKMVVLKDTPVTAAIRTWLNEAVPASSSLKEALGIHKSYNPITTLNAAPFAGAFSLADMLITKVVTVESALIEGLSAQPKAVELPSPELPNPPQNAEQTTNAAGVPGFNDPAVGVDVLPTNENPASFNGIFYEFMSWLQAENPSLAVQILNGEFEYLSEDYEASEDDPETEVNETANNPGQLLFTLGSGDDFIDAGEGDDVAYGGLGDDTVLGGEGDDVLYGDGIASGVDEHGNPIIENVGAGDDVLDGGAGDDQITAGDGNNTVDGGDGNDRIYAGDGDDELRGGSGADIISAGDGNDLIYAGDSGIPDTSVGESATDFELQDVVNAGAGEDTIYGEGGSDYISGGADNDQIYGGSGADNLSGDEGDDLIHAGEGDDTLSGGEGADTIFAEDGNDVIASGSGDDQIDAGDGDDIVQAGLGDDLVSAGAGNDTVLGEIGEDTIDGGDGNDVIAGGSDADMLSGAAGNDTLDGGSGSDQLSGGEGDDFIEGGTGTDTIHGDAGDDRIYGDDTSGIGGDADVIFAGSGNDAVEAGAGDDVVSAGVGDDTVQAGSGDDTVTGEDGNDVISGDAGADHLSGGAGNDTLDGGSGADLLSGGEGADNLAGGSDSDTLDGGAGDDVLDGGTGDDILNAGDGNDVVTDSSGADQVSLGAGNDRFEANAADTQGDVIDAGAGDDVVIAGSGNDIISGGTGNDSLEGGAGDDVLNAGDGNDTLDGGANDDTLISGRGVQLLKGGDGNDLYKVDLAGLQATIEDSSGVDKIEISAEFEPKDITLEKDGNDLLIKSRANPNHNLRISDQFVASPVIEAITFASHDFTLDLTNLVIGSDGNDVIQGTENNDVVLALGGDDVVVGAGGDDFLDGGPGKDALYGNDGEDKLHGSSEDDLLNGGADDDLINDGLGSDMLIGGTGSDTFAITKNGGDHDIIADFERGSDKIDLANFGDTFVSLKQMEYFGAEIAMNGADTEISLADGQKITVEDVNFAELNESDFGFDLREISGTTGTSLNEVIVGSNGSDVIDGGLGFDIMSGGSGADTFVIGDHAGDIDTIADFNVSEDVVDLSVFANNASVFQFDVDQRGTDVTVSFGDDQHLILENVQVEELTLDNFNFDHFKDQTNVARYNGTVLHDFTADNVIEAETALHEASVEDAAEGLADQIEAGAGADGTLDTGDGASGYGASSASYGTGAVGAGDISSHAGWHGGFNGGVRSNNAYYRRSGCRNVLVRPESFSGSVFDDLMYGNYWNEKIYAGHGDDVVYAGNGHDTVYASNGNDYVAGGNGNDIIHGSNSNSASADYNYYYQYRGCHAYLTNGGFAGYSEDDDFLLGENGHDTIYGGYGDDKIYGGNHNDYLDGGTGHDYIAGGNHNDRIYGGSGDDIMHGEHGADYINAGSGNDSAYGGIHNDTIHGGDGHDRLHGGNDTDHIYGGNHNDYITGDHGHDYLYGGHGNDDIHGGDHNDVLRGGTGNDELQGNSGNDNLDGESGNDYVHGGSGNDVVSGGDGSDKVIGDSGNDSLYGGNHNDNVHGGSGNDYVVGGSGNDAVYGDSGDDRVHGSSGNDYVNGGAGNDYVYGEDGNDSAFGSDGNDHVYGQSGSDVVSGGNGNDYVNGGSGNDYVGGDAGADTLYGEDGNDYLKGHSENDQLFGGSGNDQLHGDQGNDHLDGGNGEDLLYGSDGSDGLYGGADDDSLFAGSGNDTADGGSGNDLVNGHEGEDTLRGGSGNDHVLGEAGNDFLHGDSGSDLINGGIGSDYLEGDADRDVIVDASGENFMHGGSGADYLIGGAENDVIHGGSGSDMIAGFDGSDYIDGGTNADMIDGGAGHDYILGNHGNDELYGGGGDDLIKGGTEHDQIYGGNGKDMLHGETGDDWLVGGAENDVLNGDDGSDLLAGGTGADKIFGGNDADMIVGGQGADLLHGGSGADVFNYDALDESSASSLDVIADFNRNEDKIDLTDFDIAFDDLQISIADGQTDIAVEGTDFVLRLVGDDHDLSASQFNF